MQGPAIRIAKELGLFTVVLDAAKDAPCVSQADQFEQIDLKDKEGIEAFARSLQGSCGLSGIMTAGTDFSASVAWVAQRLGLPGIPYEAALNASDKSRMRACFKNAGLPSPEYTTVTAKDFEGKKLLKSLPLVVKPVDNMGGRGCRRVDSMAEYSEAVADALRFSRSGRAIVEAYMDGPEFSVDAIVYHGEIIICGLADRHIFFPPYFIEMGHTMPTVIEPEKQRAILETFCDGIRALGLAGQGSVGAAKGDIKFTASGPMIGEIAARLSGGYMSGWTYPYASGVEPVRAAILAATGGLAIGGLATGGLAIGGLATGGLAIGGLATGGLATGGKPDGLLKPLKNWTSAERAFISIPGTVKSISGIEAARSQPQVKDLFLRITEGSKVSFPENNVGKCGNVISAAPDRAAAVQAAEAAARSVLIRLDPADEETEYFLFPKTSHRGTKLTKYTKKRFWLFQKYSLFPCGLRVHCASVRTLLRYFSPLPTFPPNAFQLSDDLRFVFEKLPETQFPRFLSHRGTKSQRAQREEPKSSLCSPCAPCLRERSSPVIFPFPEFAASDLRDYMGRTVEESLQAVRKLSGLPLPEICPEKSPCASARGIFKFNSSDNVSIVLGRSFWAALVRGGYQGALYYIDRLIMKEK